MNALDVARWKFGITTVYHFIFVPLTIGLSILVAGMQTAWYVRKDPVYLRMTRFFGKLFLINFAMGVVTGIVQEFQFGMNWSDYSRFVGDVFGAPLAMEALLAFFLESTFLGLWIFGWDKLSPRLHLVTIWLAAIGTNLSAYFILAANSWMQHPVGYRFNAKTNRAELTSIWKVLTNSTALLTFPHVLFGAFLVGGVFLIGVAAWHLARENDTVLFRKALRGSACTSRWSPRSASPSAATCRPGS
jgi:cytochrome d ubiquinol oxidase subunit I